MVVGELLLAPALHGLDFVAGPVAAVAAVVVAFGIVDSWPGGRSIYTLDRFAAFGTKI